MNLGSKVGQKPVVVRKTEKLGERERKALFLSERTGQDDDVNPFPSSYSHLEDGVASLFFLSRNIWPCCKNDLLNNIFL